VKSRSTGTGKRQSKEGGEKVRGQKNERKLKTRRRLQKSVQHSWRHHFTTAIFTDSCLILRGRRGEKEGVRIPGAKKNAEKRSGETDPRSASGRAAAIGILKGKREDSCVKTEVKPTTRLRSSIGLAAAERHVSC